LTPTQCEKVRPYYDKQNKPTLEEVMDIAASIFSRPIDVRKHYSQLNKRAKQRRYKENKRPHGADADDPAWSVHEHKRTPHNRRW